MTWEYDFPDDWEKKSADEKSRWYSQQRNLKQAERQTKVIKGHGRDWVAVMKTQQKRLRARARVALMQGFDYLG